jgi:hypothetical protein
MPQLTFRNAEEEDAAAVVRMLRGNLLGGGFLWEVLEAHKRDPEPALQALIETPDSEYGFEQTTLAYDEAGNLCGLFIGYPRDLLTVLGPRSLTALMRGRSPLAWPGLIRAQARLARIEPPFPHSSYVLRSVCATDTGRVAPLVAEAVSEAVEEECETIVANIYESGGELEQALLDCGFKVTDSRQITDRRLAERLGTDESRQLSLATGFLGQPEDAEAQL